MPLASGWRPKPVASFRECAHWPLCPSFLHRAPQGRRRLDARKARPRVAWARVEEAHCSRGRRRGPPDSEPRVPSPQPGPPATWRGATRWWRGATRWCRSGDGQRANGSLTSGCQQLRCFVVMSWWSLESGLVVVVVAWNSSVQAARGI